MYFTAEKASKGGLRFASIQALTGLPAVLDLYRADRLRTIEQYRQYSETYGNAEYRASYRRTFEELSNQTLQDYIENSSHLIIYFSDPTTNEGTIKVKDRDLLRACDAAGLYLLDRAGENVP